MKTLRIIFFALPLLALAVAASSAAQQDNCPTIVQTALTQTDLFCKDVGRNQACYGHNALAATLRDPNAAFNTEGDMVDVNLLADLQLSPMNTDSGVWGVALMRLQANLPDTLPGQNVTMLVFGDTQLTNAVEPQTMLDASVTADTNVNVRVGASQASAVLTTLAPGQPVTAVGRSSDSGWLQVRLADGTTGWVSAPLLTSSGDFNTLSVVNPSEPTLGPMQAFYLRTGIGDPGCKEAPASGILVQTPQGAGTINLSINHVQVEMGSTLFFSAIPGDSMNVRVLEGSARAQTQQNARPLVAGGQVVIALDENLQPIGEPGLFEPCDDSLIANLPIDQLERDIDITPCLSEDDANLVNRYMSIFDRIDVEGYNALFAFIRDHADYDEEELNAAIEAYLSEDDETFEDDETYDFKDSGDDKDGYTVDDDQDDGGNDNAWDDDSDGGDNGWDDNDGGDDDGGDDDGGDDDGSDDDDDEGDDD